MMGGMMAQGQRGRAMMFGRRGFDSKQAGSIETRLAKLDKRLAELEKSLKEMNSKLDQRLKRIESALGSRSRRR